MRGNYLCLFYNEVDDVFILRCHFEQRSIPAANGYKWNRATKRWETKDLQIINRWARQVDRWFDGSIDDSAKKYIMKNKLNQVKK